MGWFCSAAGSMAPVSSICTIFLSLKEIARSEMVYTDQRPAEYTTVVVASAIKEGYRGPVFVQGDHFQVNAKKYAAQPTAEVDAVKALTDGFGADVVADFVGYEDVIPEGLRMLRGGGCYLEVGSISPGNVFSYDATALVRGNTRLVATSNYSPWALEQSLSFMKRNLERFPFEKVISHVFPLERISEAFSRADWAQRGGDPAGVSRAAISM